MAARIALYVVAAVLMAAHFLHAGDVIGVAVCLAAPALFLLRERWSLVVLQGLAYGAGLIWFATAWQLVHLRWMLGEPWHLAAAILLTVGAITMVAGGLLRGARLQLHYRGR